MARAACLVKNVRKSLSKSYSSGFTTIAETGGVAVEEVEGAEGGIKGGTGLFGVCSRNSSYISGV